MYDACPAWRGLLASVAVGDADGGERDRVLEHLHRCEPCAAAFRDITGVVSALGHSPGALPATARPTIGPLAERRVLAAIATERRERGNRVRRQRLERIAAAAAMIVAVAGIGAGLGSRARHTASPGTPIALSTEVPGVSGHAWVSARPWGTQITLEVSGMRGPGASTVWLARTDGSRVAAGSFRPITGRTLRVVLAAAVAEPEAAVVGVGTPDQIPG